MTYMWCEPPVTSGQIQSTKNLVRCERNLWEKLKALDGNEFGERTKKYLTTRSWRIFKS